MNHSEELLEKHISTHSVVEVYDKQTVNTVESYLLDSNGRINPNFAANDKWPNTDGTFEYVPNPDISRSPIQNFIVQIKGTHIFKEENGTISYRLESLAFPATIAREVTADPGILFVVLNPSISGKRRVFWKYMSPAFINNIDFDASGLTIKFSLEEEIEDTEESITKFCKKLDDIVKIHLFCRKLNPDYIKKEQAERIVQVSCDTISDEIARQKIVDCNSRDIVSRAILNRLHDLCYGVLVLNAYNRGMDRVNEKVAMELALLSSETKFLYNFLKGILYKPFMVPEDGQAERLMLKYYDYLWEIRDYLKKNCNMSVLDNLEDFPVKIDEVDKEYYAKVALAIEGADFIDKNLRSTRYYVQKKTPFFVGRKKYYEITLQQAGLYATKFNRITVYTKNNILTEYSIQIAYEEIPVPLWGIENSIKYITSWKVSINPANLNLLAKILKQDKHISCRYGEYDSLMSFLTDTGMDFLDLINLSNDSFKNALDAIYKDANTVIFKEVWNYLRYKYSYGKRNKGRHTIRYILTNMREDTLHAVLPNEYTSTLLSDDLYLSSRCYPFENKPLITNLVGKKTNTPNNRALFRITQDDDDRNEYLPYASIDYYVKKSGELYIDSDKIRGEELIISYNNRLSCWDKNNGFEIKKRNNKYYIDEYEKDTESILRGLLSRTTYGDRGQAGVNRNFLESISGEKIDPIKEKAIKKCFVKSRILLVYGAAGTGKTTLISYISRLMGNVNQLFLTKTHTALQNMKRRVTHVGDNADFMSINKYIEQSSTKQYDIVFIDECSTIDNRSMCKFLNKIDDNCLLVLSGDIHQIEAIDFSNWFYYAKELINMEGAIVELQNTWRTTKDELIDLWDAVRANDDLITQKLVMDGPFSTDISRDIFEPICDDEIVLCLNYDGKFGLNNINRYFQNSKEGETFSWEEWTFKIGDPIIFVDNKRSMYLYNNLRGEIVDIERYNDKIIFYLDIYIHLSERVCRNETFDFIESTEKGTKIKLEIFAENEEDVDDNITTVIPFQIAYAVSIHKAQGLEYDSVKVIIPSSNSERISHSIFYTAVTRAKQDLKIYWSSETMKAIIENFGQENRSKESLEILKNNLKE